MRWLVMMAMAVVLAACDRGGNVDPATKIEKATRDMGEAAKKGDMGALGDATRQLGKALGGSALIDPVDQSELKALLPDSVAGMKRSSSGGSRSSVVGIVSSHAQAEFEDGKGARMTIEISDMGSLTGVTALAFAWVNVDIDKQGDNGYERTTMLDGRKAYERYSKTDRTGALDVLVAGRFVVSAKGTGIDMKTFKDVIARLDLDRLEKLKNKGLAPEAAPPGKPPPRKVPLPAGPPDRA